MYFTIILLIKINFIKLLLENISTIPSDIFEKKLYKKLFYNKNFKYNNFILYYERKVI